MIDVLIADDEAPALAELAHLLRADPRIGEIVQARSGADALRHLAERAVAVAFLDLDDFKQLNDTRGHKEGDRALRATAVALKKRLRNTDIVARLGGDEFAVFLPEISFEAAHEAGRKMAAIIGKNRVFANFSAKFLQNNFLR